LWIACWKIFCLFATGRVNCQAENRIQNEIDVVTANGLSPYMGPKILNEVEYVEIND